MFYFKEQRISDSAAQREHFEKSKIDFLDALVANLNSRFPAADTTLLISFSVLDPQKLSVEADLPTYGNAELDTLCEHYGSAKVTNDGCELPAILDAEEHTSGQRLTDNQTLSLQYPNITKLLTIALTLPVSTVHNKVATK